MFSFFGGKNGKPGSCGCRSRHFHLLFHIVFFTCFSVRLFWMACDRFSHCSSIVDPEAAFVVQSCNLSCGLSVSSSKCFVIKRFTVRFGQCFFFSFPRPVLQPQFFFILRPSGVWQKCEELKVCIKAGKEPKHFNKWDSWARLACLTQKMRNIAFRTRRRRKNHFFETFPPDRPDFFVHLFLPKFKNTTRNPEKTKNEKKSGAVFSKWYIEMQSKLAGNSRSQQHKNLENCARLSSPSDCHNTWKFLEK